jgi:hypothetical protein
VEDLKRISRHFHLGLKIEEGKPETEIQRTNRTPVVNEEASLWDWPIKDQFRSFMLRRGPESTAKGYTNTLDRPVREWINKEVDQRADSIFSYTTYEDARLCVDLLKASPAFVAENTRMHNSMSAALNKYLLFIEERERRQNKINQ